MASVSFKKTQSSVISTQQKVTNFTVFGRPGCSASATVKFVTFAPMEIRTAKRSYSKHSVGDLFGVELSENKRKVMLQPDSAIVAVLRPVLFGG
jgi:hypothetical protein